MSNQNYPTPIHLRGVLRYPRLQKPDSEYENYNTQVTQLSPAAVAKLEEAGITVHVDKDDGSRYIKITSNLAHKPRLVMDDTGETIGETPSLGNGTVVKVSVSPFTPKKLVKGKEPTVTAKTFEYRIVELVEFISDRATDEDSYL